MNVLLTFRNGLADVPRRFLGHWNADESRLGLVSVVGYSNSHASEEVNDDQVVKEYLQDPEYIEHYHVILLDLLPEVKEHLYFKESEQL